jgi:predicted HicB family RNase H-like nuclease
MALLKEPTIANYKQLTVRIPPELHRALRIRAAEEGRPLTIIVEGMLRQYLVGGDK